MRTICKAILTLFLSLSCPMLGQQPSVVVLGVEHSSQLINSKHQPAVLRTFINKVKPAAICIERAPEEFLRNDFYEFTYEQQSIIVPYGKKNGIPIYAIDWLPNSDDLKLAFGTDKLEVPSFTRNPNGFWGFTVFSESTSLDKDFYFADDQEYSVKNRKWYETYPENIHFDFARRLFLYRTFLQAKRIQEVLKVFGENDTVLVVVGALHKNEIENILKGIGYAIIKPSFYGEISDEEISNNYLNQDAYAILSFNLLGMQSIVGNQNIELIKHALDMLKNDKSPEKDFFKIKYDLISAQSDSESAIKRYKELLGILEPQIDFTWTGVKDKSRIDSYFDPFGNLTLNQRIKLEIAREYLNINNHVLYKEQIDSLIDEFKGLKKSMLLSYIETYII